MSEAASDALSALRDHTPSLKDIREHAPSLQDLRDHAPSLKDVDVSALTDAVSDKLPDVPAGKKRFAAFLIAALALGGTAFALLRRRSTSGSVSPSIYTPPLPKP